MIVSLIIVLQGLESKRFCNTVVSVRWKKNQYRLYESNNTMDGIVTVCLVMKGNTQKQVSVYVSTNDDVGTAAGIINTLLKQIFEHFIQ